MVWGGHGEDSVTQRRLVTSGYLDLMYLREK